jgi:hypothetical protein
MDGRQGRTWRGGSVSFGLAVIVAVGVVSGCSGETAVVPATATLSPPAPDGGSGWYRSGPVLTLAGAETAGAAYGLQYSMDDGKSWQNYSAPVTLRQTAGETVSYRTTDIWGLPTATGTLKYKSDRTDPVVTYTGAQGWYWNDAYIFIECIASDALSGLARTSCSPIQGQAWTYGYGVHTYSASANDVAGNTGQGSVSFQVMDPIIFLPLDPVIIANPVIRQP